MLNFEVPGRRNPPSLLPFPTLMLMTSVVLLAAPPLVSWLQKCHVFQKCEAKLGRRFAHTNHWEFRFPKTSPSSFLQFRNIVWYDRDTLKVVSTVIAINIQASRAFYDGNREQTFDSNIKLK